MRLVLRATIAIATALVAPCAHAAPSVAVWSSPVELANGEAHRGPWRMNNSDYRYLDDATVDLASDGDAAVAWVDNGRKDVFFARVSRDGERRFEQRAPVNVSQNPTTFSWLPRVLVNPANANEVFVLFQEIIFSGGSHGGETLFARSEDGGRTFAPPINLSNSAAGDGKGRLSAKEWHNGSLALTRSADGTLLVAWTEYEGTLWLRRSSDAGKTFSAAIRLENRGDMPARAPSIATGAVGPAKKVYVAWAVGEHANANIQFASSSDGGESFSAPRVVGKSAGHSDAPSLAVNPAGTVHLVYAESPRGPHQEYSVRYARMRAGAKGFEAPRRPVSGVGSEKSHFPQVAIDGRGRVALLWEHYPDNGPHPKALVFTGSRDGGNNFAAPTRVLPAPSDGFHGSQQGLMKRLAVSHSGNDGELAIASSTYRSEQASVISLLRGRWAR